MLKYNIIVNADDFGKDSDVNKAILKSFQDDLCSSATILCNLNGFDEAVAIISDNNLYDNVGIHLNLTEGKPLTENMKKSHLFCDKEGYFMFKKNAKRIFRLTNEEKGMVYKELSAQINRCRKNSINITHADSHNHMHEEPALIWLFIKVINDHKIQYIRKLRNIGRHASLSRKIYRDIINKAINMRHVGGTDYFCGINHFSEIDHNRIAKGSKIEIMIHPGKVSGNNVFDVFDGTTINETIGAIKKTGEMMSYNNLKR